MIKDRENSKDLNEIFRQKLENYEIIPSATFEETLMKRVGRREFLRFDAARFNIYYAGAIVAAVAALTIILITGNEKNDSLRIPLIESKTESVIVSQAPETVESISGKQQYAATSKTVENASATTDNKAKSVDPVQIESKSGNQESEKSTVTQISANSLPVSDVNLIKSADKGFLKKSGSIISASATEGCVPLKVKFSSNSFKTDSCRWVFGDGGSSKEKEPEWIFDEEGEYKVILSVKGVDGSQSSVSTTIMVHPRPTARFEITPDDASIPQDRITFLNYSTGAVKYKWDFGNGETTEVFEPSYTYSKYGKYNVSLTAISENGCSHTLTVKNAFAGSVNQITFPNAFIPNAGGATGGYYSPTSDEAALIFHPVFKGVSEYQLRIFSRRGVEIFESNDLYIGWDGFYNGQICDPGVYVWKVRGTYINGEPFTKMGDVTILRN